MRAVPDAGANSLTAVEVHAGLLIGEHAVLQADVARPSLRPWLRHDRAPDAASHRVALEPMRLSCLGDKRLSVVEEVGAESRDINAFDRHQPSHGYEHMAQRLRPALRSRSVQRALRRHGVGETTKRLSLPRMQKRPEGNLWVLVSVSPPQAALTLQHGCNLARRTDPWCRVERAA